MHTSLATAKMLSRLKS